MDFRDNKDPGCRIYYTIFGVPWITGDCLPSKIHPAAAPALPQEVNQQIRFQVQPDRVEPPLKGSLGISVVDPDPFTASHLHPP
jgi:hypothetical protein